MTTLATLPPDELREAAKRIVGPREAGSHWSYLAQVIGAVDDRRLYEDFGCASTRAWADEDLGMSHARTMAFVKLWRIMLAAHPGVPFEAWLAITEGKALIVGQAMKLGGNAADWIRRAMAASSEEALRAEWKAMVGEEVWTDFVAAMPADSLQLLEAALILALAEVEGLEQPTSVELASSLIYRREITHRALVVICKTYVEERARPA